MTGGRAQEKQNKKTEMISMWLRHSKMLENVEEAFDHTGPPSHLKIIKICLENSTAW